MTVAALDFLEKECFVSLQFYPDPPLYPYPQSKTTQRYPLNTPEYSHLAIHYEIGPQDAERLLGHCVECHAFVHKCTKGQTNAVLSWSAGLTST
ncbi:hypothetical protein TNCV_4023151 [Trichonephila clavipes]|nr:hypothetical protein TNCV_4023151 [Trichonephila clavipes]